MKRIFRVVFAVYCLLMLWLLFGQRLGYAPWGTWWEMVKSSVNLVPFRTIGDYILMIRSTENLHLVRHAFVNLAGNIVMFVPLGVFLPVVGKRTLTFGGTMLLSLCIIASVEVLQLLTLLGSMDIDDLIFNMAGAALGYGIYAVVRRFVGAYGKAK